MKLLCHVFGHKHPRIPRKKRDSWIALLSLSVGFPLPCPRCQARVWEMRNIDR